MFDLPGDSLLRLNSLLEVCVGGGVLLLKEWYYLHEHFLVLPFCVLLCYEAVFESFTLYDMLLG